MKCCQFTTRQLPECTTETSLSMIGHHLGWPITGDSVHCPVVANLLYWYLADVKEKLTFGNFHIVFLSYDLVLKTIIFSVKCWRHLNKHHPKATTKKNKQSNKQTQELRDCIDFQEHYILKSSVIKCFVKINTKGGGKT